LTGVGHDVRGGQQPGYESNRKSLALRKKLPTGSGKRGRPENRPGAPRGKSVGKERTSKGDKTGGTTRSENSKKENIL